MDEQTVRRYLGDALCDALFRQPGPMRLWRILEGLAPDARMSAATASDILKADPRFTAVETRWDLATRAEIADRPLGGALDAILQAYGRPMPEALLLSELCLSKTGDPEDFRVLLERLLRSNREVGSDGQHVYLNRWLANTASAEDSRLLYLNGLDDDESFQKALKRLRATKLKGRTPLETAEAVVKAYGQPLDNRALGLVLWSHHDDRFDAAEVLSAMLSDERFLLLSGPRWLTVVQAKTLLRDAAKLRGEPEEPPAPPDMGTVLQAPPAQRLKLTEEQTRAVLALTQQARLPVTLSELVTDVLELRPRQRNFTPAAHALEELLNNDLRLLRLQRGQYLSREAIPDWVRTVPELLRPVEVPLGPREVSPDVLLDLSDLTEDLAEMVRDPFYEDQGETEVLTSGEDVELIRMPVAYHHYRLGTMKLRLGDRRLLAAPGPVTMVTFVTPAGVGLPVWVNNDTRLLYGLLEWYERTLHPTGSLLTIRRLPDVGDTFELGYDGETDPGTYIGRERFAQLLELGERLRRRRAFLRDIVTELLHQNDKGLAFDQLWAQVNIVRRATRLRVASILSHYPEFSLSSGRWMAEK